MYIWQLFLLRTNAFGFSVVAWAFGVRQTRAAAEVLSASKPSPARHRPGAWSGPRMDPLQALTGSHRDRAVSVPRCGETGSCSLSQTPSGFGKGNREGAPRSPQPPTETACASA